MLFKKMFSNLVFLTKGEVSNPHIKYPLNTKNYWTAYFDAGIGQASLAGIIGFFWDDWYDV